jgi:predicted transcriptional regulator
MAMNRRSSGPRRPPGALEAAIMGILWAADRALSPSEVQAELDGDLAYNTVQTILTRLLEKGLVARVPTRRGHAYRPVEDAATMAARQMRTTLAHQTDRHEVLLHFAEGLEPEDARVLRALLAGLDAGLNSRLDAALDTGLDAGLNSRLDAALDTSLDGGLDTEKLDNGLDADQDSHAGG